MQDANTTDTTLNPGQSAVGTGIALVASAVTGINGGSGFQSTDVGRFVFLSAGMKFNNFYNSLSLAKSSAVDFTGFLCGRSIWYDAINIFSCDSNEKFVNWILNEGKSRLVKLKSTL